jgi:hypothetical protein
MQTTTQIRQPFIDIRAQIDLLRTQKSDHVYVMNKTRNARNSEGGVIISLHDEHGKEVSVSCPKTFIPVDIAEDLPKDIIMRGTNFLNCLRQGMLEVIPDEKAEEILSTEDGLYESKRLYVEKHSGGEEQIDNDIVQSGANAVSIGQPPRPAETAPPNEPALPPLRGGAGVVTESQSTDGINPHVVRAMESNPLSDEDRYHMVKQLEADLTDMDLHYIMNLTRNERIRNWASDRRFSMQRGS